MNNNAQLSMKKSAIQLMNKFVTQNTQNNVAQSMNSNVTLFMILSMNKFVIQLMSNNVTLSLT